MWGARNEGERGARNEGRGVPEMRGSRVPEMRGGMLEMRGVKGVQTNYKNDSCFQIMKLSFSKRPNSFSKKVRNAPDFMSPLFSLFSLSLDYIL